VSTKSPLTGTILCSFLGGSLPAEIKFAGYDAIIIKGKSPKPVYIHIQDENVEIKDASAFRGLTTDETEKQIKEKHNAKTKVASIGPAGEKMVKFAAIISERRAAGRGGAGAVMASKNLKAVAVQGTQKVKVAQPEKLREVAPKLAKNVIAQPHIEMGLSKYGSSSMVIKMNEFGVLPTRNFQAGYFEGADEISGPAFDKFTVKSKTCYACPVACSKERLVKDGPYAGALTEGPEYETVYAFGSHCGVNRPDAIIAADSLCDKFGLDTMSTGYGIGFAMECYERGIIDKKDTGGIELKFGNHTGMVELIKKIAYREGLGDILADGAVKAAEKIGKGSEKYVMHSKGLELPGYDPRGLKAHGLNLATANRGACHNRGYATQETRGFPWKEDRFAVQGKGRVAKWNQDKNCFVDSAIFCVFFALSMDFELAAQNLSAVTGVDRFSSTEELLKIGERIFNLERAFNLREGFTKKQDTLPDRVVKEPMPEGPSKGQIFEINPLLDEYYRERGWNLKTGIPEKTKLLELGLKDVADELERLNLL
jgi:aldehyde:ferredoxin oxidoreductase